MTAPLITSYPALDGRSTNPSRTSITSHPTFDDRSTDHELSSAHPALDDDCSTYRPRTPLPLRYHLTTYAYRNTFFIINNKNYLIIQNKTPPPRAFTSLEKALLVSVRRLLKLIAIAVKKAFSNLESVMCLFR